MTKTYSKNELCKYIYENNQNLVNCEDDVKRVINRNESINSLLEEFKDKKGYKIPEEIVKNIETIYLASRHGDDDLERLSQRMKSLTEDIINQHSYNKKNVNYQSYGDEYEKQVAEIMKMVTKKLHLGEDHSSDYNFIVDNFYKLNLFKEMEKIDLYLQLFKSISANKKYRFQVAIMSMVAQYLNILLKGYIIADEESDLNTLDSNPPFPDIEKKVDVDPYLQEEWDKMEAKLKKYSQEDRDALKNNFLNFLTLVLNEL